MDELPYRKRLKLRNGLWYYRRRVPTELAEAFGKKIVQRSLKTGVIKKALRLRSVLDVEHDARFAALIPNL